jgi:hypothetical protein
MVPMMRRSFLLVVLLIFGAVAWVTPPSPIAAQDEAQAEKAENLLRNGGFEEGYDTFPPSDSQVGTGWLPFWVTEGLDTPTGTGGVVPVFAPSGHLEPLIEGSSSQKWRMNDGTALAGVYQQIPATVGRNILARADTLAWSSRMAEPPYVSVSPAWVRQRVGIDPLGGIDPQSPSVVWSIPGQHIDRWGELMVQAEAQAETVTIFLSAYPNQSRTVNEIFFDNAVAYQTMYNVPLVNLYGDARSGDVGSPPPDQEAPPPAGAELPPSSPPTEGFLAEATPVPTSPPSQPIVGAEPTVDPLLEGIVVGSGTGTGMFGIQAPSPVAQTSSPTQTEATNYSSFQIAFIIIGIVLSALISAIIASTKWPEDEKKETAHE